MVEGLKFGIWRREFGVCSLGLGTRGLELRPRHSPSQLNVNAGRINLPDLGFMYWGLGFMAWGLGFRVYGLGFGVKGSGFRV